MFTRGHKQGGLWEGAVEVSIAHGAESIWVGLLKGKQGLILHPHQIPLRKGRRLAARSCHSSQRSINLVQLSNGCPWQKGRGIYGFEPWEWEVTGSGRFSPRGTGRRRLVGCSLAFHPPLRSWRPRGCGGCCKRQRSQESPRQLAPKGCMWGQPVVYIYIARAGVKGQWMEGAAWLGHRTDLWGHRSCRGLGPRRGLGRVTPKASAPL